VAECVAAQVEGPRGVDAERIESIPFRAQVIYWLWRFKCEAGSNGFEVFLLEPLGIYSPQIYESLQAVQAHELVRRMEAGIPWAIKGPAEFNALKDRSWFEQFPVIEEFQTLQSVDVGVYPIIEALNIKVDAFIRENADELFK
jgi:hypothetical protein